MVKKYVKTQGNVVDKPRGQGYAAGSSWTRGQSWAVYGFAMAYRYTGKREYLETALKVARYFLNNLPDDGVPPVDFIQSKEPALVLHNCMELYHGSQIQKPLVYGDFYLLEALMKRRGETLLFV